MSDTKRTIHPYYISDETPPEPESLVEYETELAKISRTRQFVVEMDLINCQNAYSQVLAQQLRYTQEFDNAVWGLNGGTTVNPDTHVAPDGSMTADTISFSSDDDAIYQDGDGDPV